MKFTNLYSHRTGAGIFYIAQSDDGRFHPVFQEESLGSYATPAMAAEELAGGHTFSAPGILDTTILAISEDLLEWDSIMKL